MQSASLIVYVYAALVAAGGLIGYLKANSLLSLIMGSVSFVALLAAAHGMRIGQAWGLLLANGLTLLLLVFFGLRYTKSRPRAFMPGSLMVILSMLTLVVIMLTKK